MLVQSWKNLVGQWLNRFESIRGLRTGGRRRRPGHLAQTRFAPWLENLETRVLLAGDSFESNETWQTASDLGVIPGVHRGALSIDVVGDHDWYTFELLRPDDLAFQIDFNATAGNLSFELVQVSAGTPTTLQSSIANTTGAGVQAVGLAPGRYYLHVFGGGNTNTYSVAVDPASTSSTRVLYVNDGLTTNDYYTLAAGSTTNSGLSPLSPKASIQQLLDNYTLGPQDLVVVDTGTYSGAVLATSGDEGVIYAGSPGTSRLNATFELADSDYNTLYRLTLAGPTKALYIRGTTVDPTTNTTVQSVRVLASTTGIQIDGGRDQLIADTVIEGAGSYGLSVSNAGAVTLLRSTISQRNYGAYFYYTSPVVIDSSDISALTYGVYSYGGANLIVTNTALHHAQYGLYRTGGAVLATGNRIYSNQVGAQSESDASASVFSGNEVYLNTTGLSGYGRFGGTSWEPGEPNDIYGNVTGLKPSFGQPVQFNRIRDNTVGVQQSGVRPSGSTVTSSIHHNLLWNNSTGILVSGGTHAALVNNTVVTASGTGVRLQQGASQVALRNNIFSTTGGYGLSVATDSQFGFSSDYNNHHASGSGQPVWWQKPFADLYDWQVEADYDRHSLGYTVIDPNRDDPRFANPAAGDFRLLSNSTSIDAGDPSDVFTAEPGPNGPRIDLGAYGNTPLATPSAARSLRLEYPEFYADWPVAEGRSILWRTYDSDTADKRLSGLVSIDLYTSTGTVVAHIATVPASDESYGWSPEASGLTGSLTSRYRIQISSVSDPSLADSSREEFAVPPDGAFYYVNDSSIIGDEWTAVAGNNRATGKSAGDPKANLLPVLRAYDLGPGDQVRIDTGSYIHVRNVVLSGNITLGNDEGMTITGPTNPATLAQLNRANTASWATNIELNDADYVTLRNLSLTGAGTGLWVRNGSTNFRGDRLTSLNNSSHGFLLESDAVASQVDFLTAGGNGGDGIRILTSVDSVSNSLAYNNTGTGIFISHSGATTAVEANRVYGNRVGIDASGNVVVGNANLATGRGNLVSGNSSDGIRASGSLVVGNTVWGHTGSGAAGILLTNSAPARDNVVHGNSYGIRGSQSSTEITRNRVFNNSLVGIRALHASVIQGNVVYANPIGLEAVVENTWFSGTISNNLIYANPSMAIRLEGKGARITGNTIYQPSGDGLVVEGSSTSATVRNNVFSLAAGAALSVASNSQVGFQSDSNLFHITGTGKVAFWQGAARTTLSAWYNTVFQDENSLASDPLFVSPAGPDGILGYSATATTDFGSDDDFHEQSDYGSFHGGSLAPIRDTVTGLPVTAPGAWINDALRSPTIDRGRAGDPYVNEPSGNGGYLNLGAYGNTPQASKSPAEYVLVTRPDGGEVWPARQTFPIRWRSHDNLGNVHIELWQTGGTTAVSRIATDTPNDGEFLWQIPTTITPGTDYRIRVIRTDNQALLDQSNSNFEITPPITVYYVNDGSTVGDEYSL
ncbi:MAG: right-handed parallel beta-helix repeat-containing protein, partial [Planctomycetaceae bacterium]